MARNLADWITAYVKYASVIEAPRRMHFWAGVTAVAGALRRRVWIDMKRYMVFPNFYTMFVAKPGIIAKSTTADVAMNLLKQVPGINFGPDIVTWPALTSAFAEAGEMFEYQGDWHPMSAMTLVASEMGNLINPQDRDMVNLYINLWDGRKQLDKKTKTSGNDMVEAPWINMIACTTPSWIADCMPKLMIGGGLASRILTIYAERKEKFVPFVDEVVGDGDAEAEYNLVHDLEHIAITLVGPVRFTPDARAWERERYTKFWEAAAKRADSSTIEGYAARKQTHLFKTSMVLSASRGDDLLITLDDLQLAETMLVDLEPDMEKAFSSLGRTDDSRNAELVLDFIRRKGAVKFEEVYKQVYVHFPDPKVFENTLLGAVRAGYMRMESRADGMWIVASLNGAVKAVPTKPAMPSVDTEFRDPS